MKPNYFANALLVTAMCTISQNPCVAQIASPTILQIRVGKGVDVAYGVVPPVRKSPSPAVLAPTYNAITEVNGQPATGTWSSIPFEVTHATATEPPVTTSYVSWTFDLAEADGTPAGALTAVALTGSAQYPIVSATGAYLGAQGFIALESSATADAKSPLNSKTLNSKISYPATTFSVTLYPAVLPSVAMTSNGPAVAHSADSTAVSASQPAQSGEIVTIYALNLLPQSGSTASSMALPVHVTLGGVDAPVLWAGVYGDPSNAGYQINVRIPSGLNSGMADLQLVSGFMAGPAVALFVDAGSGR